MKNQKLSPIQAKWIGLRLTKIRNGRKILRSAGFWHENIHTQRNGCNWLMPCATKSISDFGELFARLSQAGCLGVAFQWTDLQWKYGLGITEAQWANRINLPVVSKPA